jgi:hypothetical protein
VPILSRAAEAPLLVWIFSALLLAERFALAIVEGDWGRWVGIPIAAAFALYVLAGVRVIWQIAIVLMVISLLLFAIRPDPWWAYAFELIGLACLVAPRSRAYFVEP